MQSVDLLTFTVSLLLLCLWSSAFTDILPTKRRERAQMWCPIFVCVCGERKQSVSLTHTSWFLDSFNFSHGKTLRSLLSVPLRGIRLQFHHPAFIPVFLLLHWNISASLFLFSHTCFEPFAPLHCHCAQEYPWVWVVCISFEHSLSLSAGVSLALGGWESFAHSTKVSFLCTAGRTLKF